MTNSRFMLSSVESSLLNLFLALVVIGGGSHTGCHGFAYAPNFITKIIQEDTGICDPQAVETEPDETPAAATIPITSAVKTRFPPEPNDKLTKIQQFVLKNPLYFHPNTLDLDKNPTDFHTILI